MDFVLLIIALVIAIIIIRQGAKELRRTSCDCPSWPHTRECAYAEMLKRITRESDKEIRRMAEIVPEPGTLYHQKPAPISMAEFVREVRVEKQRRGI